jgi:hypothetical protein
MWRSLVPGHEIGAGLCDGPRGPRCNELPCFGLSEFSGLLLLLPFCGHLLLKICRVVAWQTLTLLLTPDAANLDGWNNERACARHTPRLSTLSPAEAENHVECSVHLN